MRAPRLPRTAGKELAQAARLRGWGRRGQAEPRLPHAANAGRAGGEQALHAPVPWCGAASAWFLQKKRAECAETAPGLRDASHTVCPAAATTALPTACNARDYTGSGSTNWP